MVNAKKSKLQRDDALELAQSVTDVYATKGKKVVHLDLTKRAHDDETLSQLLLGPTGNLRAPTMRSGTSLVVGFDEQTFRAVLR